MGLYHFEIGLPKGFRLPDYVVALVWTRHAQQASRNDRYRDIPQWKALNLASCETIEVEVTNKRVDKVVVRTSLDSTNDVVYVLIPKGSQPWVVKTVWINRQSDTHKTLDRSKYVC